MIFRFCGALLLCGFGLHLVFLADERLERKPAQIFCADIDIELKNGVKSKVITQDEADRISTRCWTLYGGNS